MSERVGADTGSDRLARERNEIAGAILLVAGGRFPQVLIVNLPDAVAIAQDLRGEAARMGVRLILAERADGPGCAVRVVRA